MDKTLLLPHWFKRIGWVLFIPTALFGLLMAIDGFNGVPSYLLPEAVARGELLDHLCNNIVLFGILLGVLFITCSRERIEDECIARIRLNALLGGALRNLRPHADNRPRALRLRISLLHDFQPLPAARTLSHHRAAAAVEVQTGGPT